MLAFQHTWKLVHSPFFAFGTEVIVKNAVRQYFYKYFFEGRGTLYCIIIIDLTQGFVEYIPHSICPDIAIITADIPTMGKKILILKTCHCKFPNGNAEFFRQGVYCFVHIVYGHMLSAKTQELFGTPYYSYFIFCSIGETYHIANNITPCTGTCGKHYCIFHIFFHFVDKERFWIGFGITFFIKIIAGKWYELIKYACIQYKLYSPTRPGLETE